MTPYLNLIRFDRPVGWILLLWPCLWGLAYAAKQSTQGIPLSDLITYGITFTMGAFLMRSAGCIINDCVDRHLDKLVERTKNRPLASGAISIPKALIFAALLTLPALFIFISLPFKAQIASLWGVFLLFIYPFAKRWTHFPQFVLGLAFNSGILITWFCFHEALTLQCIALYGAGIFWTMAYDTIYAFQDVEDDIKVNIKSTAVLCQTYPKPFVGCCYMLQWAFLTLSEASVISQTGFLIGGFALLMLWTPSSRKSSGTFFKAHMYASTIGLLV
jgi:4-hydroxybenzoate polyprenyl transferase